MGVGAGRFRRAQRLRRSWEFQRVSRRGKRWVSAEFVLIAASRDRKTDDRRLGVTVSRRVGNAVVRNQVKRAVREWFRLGNDRLVAGVDVVVIARRPAAKISACETEQALTRLAVGSGLTLQ